MHFFYQIHTHDLFACRCGHLAYTPHIHSHLEIMHVARGEMDVTVDEQSYHLKTGDMVVVFPHHPHSFETMPAPEKRGEAVTVVVVNPQLAGDYAEQIFSTAPTCPVIRKEQLESDMLYAIDQLLYYSELTSPERYHPSIAKSYTQLLLARIWPMLAVEPAANAMLHSATYKAIQYMRQHFQEPLSLESVADALNISKRQVSRLFSDTIHIGFHQYLLDLRTEHAKNLLQNPQIPITEVAYQAGFESQRTFNRAFREFYGVSPREYRKSFSQSES